MSPASTVRRRRAQPAADAFIVPSKLDRPNLVDGLLPRPRLVEALAQHADRPLSVVVAEAGFGKTVLLAMHAARLRRPILWYSLAASDADAVVFAGYLLAGLRRDMPRQARGLQRVLDESRTGGGLARFGTVLAGALAARRGPPLLIVLDDFHEVASQPQVVQMVDLLVRHLPPTARLLIGSRTTPPLELDRLRLRGELFELDSGHLRLTHEELATLFADVYKMPLGDDELAALDDATQGWPTAIQLVHESLKRSPGRGLEAILTEFRASTLELQDYLSHEVFARLDPDERLVLERLAAADRFDAGLATTLTHGRDVGATLRGLARRGVLRSFGANAGASWQLHDIVRGHVRRRLESERGPGAWAALERDTADALAARGEPERALTHYLRGGAHAEAAALVRRLERPMLRQGRAATLLRCLQDLPEALVREDVALSVTFADANQSLGRWDDAERLYREALPRCQAAHDRALECRVLLGLSKVLNMRGEHEQVLGMAERGLAMAAELDLELRVRLLQRKAGAHFYLGHYAAAARILEEVRAMLPADADAELLLPTLHNLALALAARGRIREAIREFGAALAHVRGTPSPRAPLYLSNLSTLLAETGELAEARAAAEDGLDAAARLGNRAQEITCREALAQALAQAGDLDGALAALKTAEAMNREQRMELVAGDLLALRGRIFCARGQYRRAVAFLEEALEQPAVRADSPRHTEFVATLAWCELRAGRARVAYDRLRTLLPRADAEEDEYRRMRVHYWAAEALLALGGDGAEVRAHLGRALELVRARGYAYFLSLQAAEEPAPLLHALAHGIEIDTVCAALAEVGAAIEQPLLDLLPGANPAVAEAAIAVLAEVGGARASERLTALTKAKRPISVAAARTALRRIAARLERGAAPAGHIEARLRLFGSPGLDVEDRAIPASAWRSQRAFHILVYLALHPQGATREVLLETFWPGRRLAAGRRNFHPTLSYVRSVLPRADVAPLRRDGDTYRLDPAYPLTCDAWDVQRALEAARAARSDDVRREALERALEPARHPFLEGLYDNWADELQVRMRDRLERAHVELGDLLVRSDEWEPALEHFRRAAEFDGYRESTRAAIVECLVHTGNRRAALVEWERLRTLLRDELAVEPLPETTARVRACLGSEFPRTPETPQPSAPLRVVRSGQVALKRHA